MISWIDGRGIMDDARWPLVYVIIGKSHRVFAPTGCGAKSLLRLNFSMTIYVVNYIASSPRNVRRRPIRGSGAPVRHPVRLVPSSHHWLVSGILVFVIGVTEINEADGFNEWLRLLKIVKRLIPGCGTDLHL